MADVEKLNTGEILRIFSELSGKPIRSSFTAILRIGTQQIDLRSTSDYRGMGVIMILVGLISLFARHWELSSLIVGCGLALIVYWYMHRTWGGEYSEERTVIRTAALDSLEALLANPRMEALGLRQDDRKRLRAILRSARWMHPDLVALCGRPTGTYVQPDL